MRYFRLCLLLLLVACQGMPSRLPPREPLDSDRSPGAFSTLLASPTPADTLSAPFHTSTPASIATATPASQPDSTATPGSGATFQVRFHPDGGLYVGDLVSVEVVPPEGVETGGRQVKVSLGPPPGVRLGEEPFAPAGLGLRIQSTLQWVWNTANLPAGQYTLTFSVEPDGPVWIETVALQPRGQLPPGEGQAAWSAVESDCCLVYYLTNTAAHRDLPGLLQMMDEQAQKATQKMGLVLGEPIRVVLLPRVAGHGGFASQEVVISYLDRDYAAGDTATVFHHELIHMLDARLGGTVRPSMLIEGLAVYQSGGHYEPEPLIARAAALLPPEPGCMPATPDPSGSAPSPGSVEACGLDRYVPIAALADQFYLQQHEISYLEAGALVEFMIQTWGWSAYSAFYRDIQIGDIPSDKASGQPSIDFRAVDAALQRHFGLGLDQLEAMFLRMLQEQFVEPGHVIDVRLMIRYYDAMRRYQQLLHPAAYFMNAWLPDIEAMRQRKIVADAVRRPSQPENLALETMFVSANEHLLAGEYAQADRTLDAIQTVLDGYEQGGQGAFQLDPLAADYFALVSSVLEGSYLPEEIQIKGAAALVVVSETGPQLLQQSYLRAQEGWILMSSAGMATDGLRWSSH